MMRKAGFHSHFRSDFCLMGPFVFCPQTSLSNSLDFNGQLCLWFLWLPRDFKYTMLLGRGNQHTPFVSPFSLVEEHKQPCFFFLYKKHVFSLLGFAVRFRCSGQFTRTLNLFSFRFDQSHAIRAEN